MVHPLDQLSVSEMSCASAACLEYAQGNEGIHAHELRYNVVSLKEPTKGEVVAWMNGGGVTKPPRLAFCILELRGFLGLVEVVVELAQEKVTSWTKVHGVRALATPDDCIEAEAICKADPEVRRLLEQRYGISGDEALALLCCDPWSVHPAEPSGRKIPPEVRPIQLFLYMRSSMEDNAYAHPLDMTPLVDMRTGKVFRIDLPYEATPPPPWNKVDVNYHHKLQEAPWRDDIKPLDVLQPMGPSFDISGNEVQWQKWHFHLGFNYREGVVLNCLKYDGRPVAHRLSIVEMAVPYAEPRAPYTRKCAFDVGDYGLGYCSTSLALGCDCLGSAIKYFDAVLPNSKGVPQVVPKVVCMHEEDVGLLWKHVDYRSGHSESRRSRRLVINFVATVVNYEYQFNFSLYQDGSVQIEIKLTGELSTNMLSEGEGPMPEYGVLVAPNGVNAQHHQHMFCARLDMSVDNNQGGQGLVVSEVNVQPLPAGASNPCGNAFQVVETDLTSVHQAIRDIAPEKGRMWKVKNPASINPISKAPVAFKLIPAAHPPLLAVEGSAIREKAFFAAHNLFVTPHSDDQLFPAGDYVFGAATCTGLHQWTAADAPLVGADPVLWYSFGVTHVVRVEDFPVMPVEVCGFMLKPYGFFTANPGLDVPPSKNVASKEVSSCGTCPK